MQAPSQVETQLRSAGVCFCLSVLARRGRSLLHRVRVPRALVATLDTQDQPLLAALETRMIAVHRRARAKTGSRGLDCWAAEGAAGLTGYTPAGPWVSLSYPGESKLPGTDARGLSFLQKPHLTLTSLLFTLWLPMPRSKDSKLLASPEDQTAD